MAKILAHNPKKDTTIIKMVMLSITLIVQYEAEFMQQ